MSTPDTIRLEAYYPYGYKGREMIAIRAPWAMSAEASEIIGCSVQVAARRYIVLQVLRQVVGPIHAGEPIGIEVRELRVEDVDRGDSTARFRG